MPVQRCRCGAKYRLPDSAIGKKAKCQKCGELFVIEAESDEGAIPIANDGPDIFAQAAEHSLSVHQQQRAEQEIAAATAQERFTSEAVSAARWERTAIKGYWGSVGWSFLFVTSLGDMVTFVIMWGMICIAEFLLVHGGILGSIGQIIVWGWWYGLLFNTMDKAASGEDDIPEISGAHGMVDEIIIPAVKWAGTWLVAFTPAILFLLFIGLSSQEVIDMLQLSIGAPLLSQVSSNTMIFIALITAGFFFWPMIALCVVLGGFTSMIRFDLIFWTIIKTFPVYLLTAGLVCTAGLVGTFGVALAESSSCGVVSVALVWGLHAYLALVSMRCVGLYYHHFKHKFAWDWG